MMITLSLKLQIWVTFDLLRYCSQICREICDHLRICLFTIPYGTSSTRPSGTSNVVESGIEERNGTHTRYTKQRLRKQLK